MITSVVVIFFFWWYFFFAEGNKKKILTLKKNTHQQAKLLIQRKHVYTYNMPFLCPTNVFKIFHLLYTERKIVVFFFNREFPLEQFQTWYFFKCDIFFWKIMFTLLFLNLCLKKKYITLKKKISRRKFVPKLSFG